MAGEAQLSDQEHIERRPECSGYFVPDRYTPAGQCQHDDITAAFEPVEVRRKRSTGISSIAIRPSLTLERHAYSSRWFSRGCLQARDRSLTIGRTIATIIDDINACVAVSFVRRP
jgi:hypothetical protein